MKLMIRLLNPKYFIPIEGNHFLLHYNAKVAASMGFPKENIFISDNGQVMEFKAGAGKQTKVKLPADYVFVDGLGVSDETNIVLRDRQVLAEDGMIVVIATVDSKTGRLVQNPDIISRGFIYLKESQELLKEVRHKIRHIVEEITVGKPHPINWAHVRDNVRERLGSFLFHKENKELIEDLRHRVKKLVIDSDPLSWADTNYIRNKIRDYVGQFLYTKTEKRPMVLPVVIEV